MKKARFIKPLTISLTIDAFDQIQQISDREEVSMSEIVRKAIHAGMMIIEQGEMENQDSK